LIADAKMDVRSCELRDYLVEPKGIEASLRLLNLASSSVLANAIDLPRRLQRAATKEPRKTGSARQAPDTARGILLQRVANELRLGGRWRQAAEAFRRALILLPGDGRLLFEFGRFARSQGNALRNPRFHRRARAALRLSAWIGRNDPPLLARLAETNFEFGEIETASKLFRQALAGEPKLFRAELGLAEIALRDGKLAHVIHHFAASAAVAPDAALTNFAQREIDYYSQLNQDDEYLSKELRRVSWLQNVLNARRLTTRLTAAGLSLVLFGSVVYETITVIGWAVATTALIAWCGLMFSGRLLSHRREISAE
jgi:tetratricopeptide (TPR) repeat protein